MDNNSAAPSSPNPNPDQQQLLVSYLILRAGIGISAMALPLVVCVVGWFNSVSLQSSISAYYHVAPTRDIFVATLCVIGAFLLCYKGYRQEQFVHRGMGLAAIGVGMCPTWTKDCPNSPQCTMNTVQNILGGVHIFAAVVLMVLMAYTAFFLFTANQSKTQLSKEIKDRNAKWYRGFGCGIASVLALFVLRMIIYSVFLGGIPRDNTLFWVEFFAIELFGLAWLVKSHALGRLAAAWNLKPKP
jgi:hypothetical protein